MKLNLKIRLPQIDWQKYLRPALGLLMVAAFAYAGILIRSSQHIVIDGAYLKQQSDKSGLQNLKVNQTLLNSLGTPPATVPPGRSPFLP